MMICSLHSASNWCFTFSSACGYMIRVNGKEIETRERVPNALAERRREMKQSEISQNAINGTETFVQTTFGSICLVFFLRL